ncbi:PorT family protein [Candidatus Falkowbacteria bacterium]|nr:PorT family protein [Candidatus Falkowbacteria bacterium]
MKKCTITLAILILISCLESFSQIVFENGYFIDESNKKTECLIKNVDWDNNPTKFNYKLPQNDEVQIATIQSVKEFGVNNFPKYIRAKVEIDRSDNDYENLSFQRDPEFHEEILFLKVLIEGSASLYYYKERDLIRFFYSVSDSEITQLVYKQYYLSNVNNGIENKLSSFITENNYFKQQLFLTFKCHELGVNDFENIEYEKMDLERIFVKYNECTDPNYTNYQPKQKKDLFNLSIRPGINYSSLEVYSSGYYHADFGSKVGFRLGIEVESIMPFNKNKWSLFVEPNYQYFKSETSIRSNGSLYSEVDYKSIELPVGIRHYSFLNENSKLFINVACVFDIPFSSSINFKSNGYLVDSPKIQSELRLALGLGYKYKDKYILEMRYFTDGGIAAPYQDATSSYKCFSVIMGVTLF